MRFTAIVLVMSLVLFAAALAGAEDNAALVSRGARIEMGSAAPTPLNARWAKPEELLNETRPAGPIINDLVTGWATIHLPVQLDITRIGIMQGDYKGTFAKVKDVEVSAPGAKAVTFTLENKPGQVQWIDMPAKADQVTVRVKSLHAPDTGTNNYGIIQQIQVMVKQDMAKLFAVPADYVAAKSLSMPTPNQQDIATPVIGKPRKVTEHPLTIWDKQDIADIKAQTQKYENGRLALKGIVSFCDSAVANPIPVPEKPDDGVDGALASQHTAVATGIANLGIGYALTGNEAYAKEAARMLLELADRYEGWPVHQHPTMKHDSSKWSWQRLNDAIWLIPAAWGYDLVHNSPSLSDADRKKIEDHFIMPCVNNIMRSSSVIAAPTNWSVICNAAVMIGSRVCGDDAMYRKTIDGLNGDRKRGGMYFHLDNGIDDDGMWAEGAIGYQFMAMRGLVVCAEVMWHDGIDVYSYRGGRLKKVFDSPLWYCYPGGDASPAVHDSGSSSLFGRDAHLYQYALRRYGDKTYNAILAKVTPSLASVYNLFLPAREFAPVQATDLPRVPSVLFPGVGFAVARTGDGDQSKYLFLDYGPNRSHGHPDKLNFNLFALGQELFADAGSAWYTTDLYNKYYKHSLAHNTVSYNGLNQVPTGGKLEAFAQRGEIALIRAATDSAIPATVLDRTLVQTHGRVYDVVHVQSNIPFVFDLPYHSHGKLTTTVPAEPWTDRPADANGFAYFNDATTGKTDDNWKATWQVPRGRVQMSFIGEPDTTVICATTPKGSTDLGTAMLRRKQARTTFAGVADVIEHTGSPTVRGVQKIGATDLSYGLKAEVDGGYELVMVSYDNQPHQFGQWQTDARTAFVRVIDGKLAEAILAGGKQLTGPAGKVELDTAGLVVYRMVTGSLAELANLGEQTVSVRMTGLTWATAADRVVDGKRAGTVKLAAGEVSASLESQAAVELRKGDQPTIAEYEEAQRREKLAEAFAREQVVTEALKKKADAQQAQAATQAMPANYYVLIQAEDFAGQDGGEVSVTAKKTATYGSAFAQWNDRGHWLDYQFEVAHDGLYQFIMKYCREGGPAARGFLVDGKIPVDPAENFEVASTGGWSNGADQWRLHQLTWPKIDQPALIHLTKGTHTLRMINTGGDGGVNLDYIILANPKMTVTREAVEK